MKNRFGRAFQRELRGVRVDGALRDRILAGTAGERFRAKRRPKLAPLLAAAAAAAFLAVGLLAARPERATRQDRVLSASRLEWVWVGGDDSLYHAWRSCGGMEDAARVSLEQAREEGRLPCPECIQSGGRSAADSRLDAGELPGEANGAGELAETSAADFSDGATPCPTEAAYAGASPASAQETPRPTEGALADALPTNVQETPEGTPCPTEAAYAGASPASAQETPCPTEAALANALPTNVQEAPEETPLPTEAAYAGASPASAQGRLETAGGAGELSADGAEAYDAEQALPGEPGLTEAGGNSAELFPPAGEQPVVDDAPLEGGGLDASMEYEVERFPVEGRPSGIVYVGEGAFHANPFCAGLAQKTMRLEEAVDAGLSPCPECAAGLYVWATEGGRHFHAARNCSGMEEARLYTLGEALDMGKQVCAICMDFDRVWVTENGVYMHTARNCQGMHGAIEISAAATDKQVCPLCYGQPCVWTTERDSYYHTNRDCAGLVSAAALEVSDGEMLEEGKEICPICRAAQDPAPAPSSTAQARKAKAG